MTEAEWLDCDDPCRMVDQIGTRVSERKRRLLGIVCCRQSEDKFPDKRIVEAINVAERYVEGLVEEPERTTVFSSVYEAHEEHAFDELDEYLTYPAYLIYPSFSVDDTRRCASLASTYSQWDPDWPGKHREMNLELVEFLRDIFGNPFRPVAVDTSWLTSTDVGIAQAIYDDRAFDRLPILADALQDAGCENADILDHCRGDGPHVRGCWVVDLVLGKT